MANPATGYQGDRCVLALRQRQSRAFVSYHGYNFSGSLLMTGEPPPAPSMLSGAARSVRRALIRQGLSAEFLPQAALESPCLEPRGPQEVSEELLDELGGTWNLQADATLRHFMDFSDYYALPSSPLAAFRMSAEAFRSACALERSSFQSQLLQRPALLSLLYGTTDPVTASDLHRARLQQLALDPKIIASCQAIRPDPVSGIPAVVPNPPRYCMCWFFELDDSPMSQWALDNGRGMRGPEILELIESWLELA